MEGSFPNINAVWAATLAETLFRKGIRHAVVCPGSRSAPLAFGFANHASIEALPAVDERSAAFLALGLARASGRAVALVCTSGSAVANFFPAIVEASESGLPLIVLTADRPPELRQCGAGQTIDQTKIFGSYVRQFTEVGLPENSGFMLRYLRQTVAHAVELACGTDPGPVHLNLPFRDPLPPLEVAGFKPFLSIEELNGFCSDLTPPKRAAPPLDVDAIEDWREESGLLVVGPHNCRDGDRFAANVGALATAMGWPVLSDALNPLRSRQELVSNLVSGYEFILRRPELIEELRPKRVVVIGELPTCKVLREWLAALDLPTVFVSPRRRNMDPAHGRSETYWADLEGSNWPILKSRSESLYLSRWMELDRLVRQELETRMLASEELFEGKLAWSLSRLLPEAATLCVSNSMPPRDLEFYFGRCDKRLRVFSSRGANGIDGVLSAALGSAHGGGPAFVVVGDLAFLHDSNFALLSPQFRGSLTILLVDNSGGGIFEMLPVSRFGAIFERHFATPQSINFQLWAQAFGLSFVEIGNWDQLSKELERNGSGIRILRISTDRKADAARRKAWFAEIAATLV